jgi:hypothetical protein
MTKIRKLKRDAKAQCALKGHVLRRFVCNSKTIYSASCKKCGKIVFVYSPIKTRDFSIYGAAIDLNCD